MSLNEPAGPIARGTLATAKQSLGDLFHWKQRVEITNDYGETHCEWQSPAPLKNPISLFAQLGARDWLFFVVGFLAWTADAFDFHALSIQTVKLAKYFDTTKTNITTAITLTLLLRSVGAALFGLAGDKFGRKWPMVVNMLVLGLLQVASKCCCSFQTCTLRDLDQPVASTQVRRHVLTVLQPYIALPSVSSWPSDLFLVSSWEESMAMLSQW